MMRRAFETVAMDRLRRIGETCPPHLLWVQTMLSPHLQSKEPRLYGSRVISQSIQSQQMLPNRPFNTVAHCPYPSACPSQER